MKYKYNIKNLDCANCAKTIENKLNEDKNIKKAIVNFNSSTARTLNSDKINIMYNISNFKNMNINTVRIRGVR